MVKRVMLLVPGVRVALKRGGSYVRWMGVESGCEVRRQGKGRKHKQTPAVRSQVGKGCNGGDGGSEAAPAQWASKDPLKR